MTREQAIRKARRTVRIAKFERECRCTMFGNRNCKAYRVPGTRESGHHALLTQRVQDLAAKYTTESES